MGKKIFLLNIEKYSSKINRVCSFISFTQPCGVGNTASMLSKMLIILFRKVFKPDFR